MNKKTLIEQMVSELNAKGYKGGIYHYKKGECSCCYGGDKDWLFEINGNKPSNWNSFYHKISYKIDDKKTEAFRKDANRIAKKYFGKLVSPAKNKHRAIIIDTVFENN